MTDTGKTDRMRAHIEIGGCALMGNKEAVKKYQAKMDAFKIRPAAEEGQQIRAYAAAHGMSVQGLFLEALREYMENHKED